MIGEGKHVNLDDEQAVELIEINEGLTRGVNHRTGTWKVLVLRGVDSAGVGPSRSVTELGSDVFDDAFNLVSWSVVYEYLSDLNVFSDTLCLYIPTTK